MIELLRKFSFESFFHSSYNTLLKNLHQRTREQCRKMELTNLESSKKENQSKQSLIKKWSSIFLNLSSLLPSLSLSIYISFQNHHANLYSPLSLFTRVRERESRRRLVLPRNKRERRSRKNSSPIFSHFARLILFLFPPLPLLTWTVTWHRMSSFTVHVSVCALLAVDLDNSKGGSGFGRFSKGHDVR